MFECTHAITCLEVELEAEWVGVHGRIWKDKEDGGNLVIKL